MADWETEAERETVSAGVRPAMPLWESGVPYCSEGCVHHDGKRCGLLGHRPDSICEPTVAGMAELLGRKRDEKAGPDEG